MLLSACAFGAGGRRGSPSLSQHASRHSESPMCSPESGGLRESLWAILHRNRAHTQADRAELWVGTLLTTPRLRSLVTGMGEEKGREGVGVGCSRFFVAASAAFDLIEQALTLPSNVYCRRNEGC